MAQFQYLVMVTAIYIVVLQLCTIITTDSKLVDSVGYFTYSSISCIGVSSSPIPLVPQILTSMSSVVGGDSVTLNHGGELKVQQELLGPHPCPSHRGSPLG